MRASVALAVSAFFALVTSCDQLTSTADPALRSPSALVVSNNEKESKGGAGDLARSWAQQKLIRTAQIDVEVESVDESILAVQRIADDQSGVVAGSQVTRDAGGHLRAELMVHVPSDRIDAALEGLTKLGQVRRQKVSTQDVTKAYVDLETRLRVKRQTEERLRDLLRSRTGQLSQVLEVERELDRVVGEIEGMEGERNYLDRQIAVSVITIQITERGALIRPGAFSKVPEAFRGSVEVLAQSLAALVYIVSFLVPWLVAVSLIWWLGTTLKRRWNRLKGAA